MLIADAKKPFAAAKPCDLTDFFLGQVQDILNEPRLLFLHLHDDLDTAGIQEAFDVCAVIQRKQNLHTLRGCDGNMEGATASTREVLRTVGISTHAPARGATCS